MKPLLKTLAFSIFAISPLVANEEGFVPLFDGKTLEGWTSARSTGEGDWGPYSVNEKEKAIHVYAGQEGGSKQNTDCLNTDKEFSHFILKLEYKWLENRFSPRKDWDRDAGLLFHVHGDLSKVWPLSLEMQIGESPADKPHGKGKMGRFHTGDLFVLGRDLRTDTPRDGKTYNKDAKMQNGRSVEAKTGAEKPKGEWNEMEIRVHGSEKATFILNGEVVLETFNFTQKNKAGEKVPLEKGRIGLQAEWAELLYRNIRIKELPAEK
ncbi:3-keto-disaccharide hydrolase [Haloferula sp.]|uniref:3-keto-disaccharide hydrolase n=1 Tax=Haloferula sp. TaxID=2497595 RepID=UPI00329B6EEA